MPKLPGVLRITINDEDHPDNPEEWTVVDVERCEDLPADAPFVICRRLTFPLWDADNHIGRCAGCSAPIQFRPNNTIPVKICDQCAAEWVVAHSKAS